MLGNVGREIAWCRQVIHRAALKSIRKRKRLLREHSVGDYIPGNQYREWGERTPCPRAMGEFDKCEWQLILSDLPAKQGEVLLMVYVYGFAQHEVAKRMKISQQQVSRLQRRAINSLKRGLEDTWTINC